MKTFLFTLEIRWSLALSLAAVFTFGSSPAFAQREVPAQQSRTRVESRVEAPTPVTILINSRGLVPNRDNATIPPYLSSVLTTFGAKLAPRIPRGQTLSVRFDRGEITSSDPTIYAAAGPGYDNYKECVGETWWLPVIAQIACIPALWY
jgi:hypothetical protein